MKKEYKRPEIEYIEFNYKDVVLASPFGPGGKSEEVESEEEEDDEDVPGNFSVQNLFSR